MRTGSDADDILLLSFIALAISEGDSEPESAADVWSSLEDSLFVSFEEVGEVGEGEAGVG